MTNKIRNMTLSVTHVDYVNFFMCRHYTLFKIQCLTSWMLYLSKLLSVL